MGITLFFLALFIVPVWWTLRKDYKKGFFLALTLLAFMTNRLSFNAGPFEMTFQRLLLIVLTIYWLRWRRNQVERPKPPFAGYMIFWQATVIGSMIFSEVFGPSFKWMLSFSTEVVLFYFIAGTTIQDEEDVMKAFKAICTAVAIVAVLGMIEYYRGFNPALEWMGAYVEKDTEDVVVTFQHRILFGYCVSMGWPMLLVLAYREPEKKKRWKLMALSACALGCCYFSNSRGAWFGAAIGGITMYFLGSWRIKRTMVAMLGLAIVAIIVRPGIRDTLVSLTMSTFDPDSYRGMSYYYRKELWPVAIKLVHASPIRIPFGCGPLSLENMDLHLLFKYGGSTYHTGFSSWDNNYAADFAEFGYLGFGAQIMFYAVTLFSLVRYAFRAPPEKRDIAAALIAAVCVYLFGLTNVYMFSPQLKCIFLTLAVIGGRLVALPALSAQVAEEKSQPVDGQTTTAAPG